ncbi:hypothetical protein FHK02_5718 [Spirosoma sp. LMG 31448]|uniref:RNA polymerase sigma-70 region 2 domain-containing protein n=1 Tax=Spirosoma utsteinense TaxID=2585773 RepID=A0ABR6WET7_9BACT|nr:hypothetical protein [Spirosoma utsteinense]MBC3795059.1 hypothetical protein [Spirosoma utsteinense]
MEPPSAETSTLDHQAFMAFYDLYAPKLWGLILGANLPVPQAEAILLSTLTKAWQQFGPHILKQKYLLTQLLSIACREGLPVECL